VISTVQRNQRSLSICDSLSGLAIECQPFVIITWNYNITQHQLHHVIPFLSTINKEEGQFNQLGTLGKKTPFHRIKHW
jgi:hypothetical protein